jgi:two-component sensor histidine kinase
MSSLIDLQSYEISDPKDAALFQDAQGRIWSMALAHEKLYESENLSEIRMDEYILDLATDVVISYSTEYKKIQVVSHVDPVRLGIDMAVPCGLILYELISNSVKHAFNDSESGIITVTFKREENSVLNLTVRDNGAGMDDHIDLSQMTSFGLRLVNNLVMQLDGAITLTDSQGAVVEIKIPAIGVI